MLCLALAKRKSVWALKNGELKGGGGAETHKLWCFVPKPEQPSRNQDKAKAITKKSIGPVRHGGRCEVAQNCPATHEGRSSALNRTIAKYCMQTASFSTNPSSFSYFHNRNISNIVFRLSRILVIGAEHSSRVLTPDAVNRLCAGEFRARAVTGFSAAPLWGRDARALIQPKWEILRWKTTVGCLVLNRLQRGHGETHLWAEARLYP